MNVMQVTYAPTLNFFHVLQLRIKFSSFHTNLFIIFKAIVTNTLWWKSPWVCSYRFSITTYSSNTDAWIVIQLWTHLGLSPHNLGTPACSIFRDQYVFSFAILLLTVCNLLEYTPHLMLLFMGHYLFMCFSGQNLSPRRFPKLQLPPWHRTRFSQNLTTETTSKFASHMRDFFFNVQFTSVEVIRHS